MRLSDEIENQRFEFGFRGYNTHEVDEFLAKLRSDVDELESERETLRKKVAAAELLAKDAEDRTEEFMASMQADRDAASAELESAKKEGERIIREAKNAASGIMTEVRRRAGEISQETRRVSGATVEEAKRTAAQIVEDAEAEAARITEGADQTVAELGAAAEKEARRIIAAAKAEAEKLLFAARTEADNTVKAAAAEARAVVAEARNTSSALSENAERTVALCSEYITEIRSTADSVCRELDIELKNAAARISMLGQRIMRMEVTPPELDSAVGDTAAAEPEDEPQAPAASPSVNEIAEPEAKAPAEPEDIPAEEPPAPARAHAAPSKPKAQTADAPRGGYFTEEYRQVMEELFGEDVDLSSGNLPEDDDTYDYLDKMSAVTAAAEADTEDADDDDDTIRYGDDDVPEDSVTSEYVGLGSDGDDDELLDVFSGSAVDKVYKAPTDDEINGILNGF